MLTYSFEGVTGPLYEYLYRCLKKDIESGRLAAGERLPSKRAFAKNLGVSTITVEGAYGQLALEGYIHSEPKRGFFVEAIGGRPAKPAPVSAAPLALSAAPAASPAAASLLETRADMRADASTPRFELSGNHTDPECFPFSVWSKLMRETAGDRRTLVSRCPAGGLSELRRAIARHLAAFRGFAPDPAQIIVGAGSEYLYGLAVQLLGRDKGYCLENPGYRTVARVYQSCGAQVCYAGMDESGMRIEELRASGASIAHVSPTHHFPTGINMPAARRYELLAWASESPRRFVIEDDYDSEFRLEGRPIPALQSIDTEGRVIYMNTFSKTLASTVRLAYMVLPASLLPRFQERLGFLACTVSSFEQLAVARFIERGFFEKHINRMRTHYGRQRAEVLRLIAESPLAPHCRVAENHSGLHFVIELDTQLPDTELERKLLARGVRLVPLSAYYAGGKAPKEHAFLFSYSNIDLATLPEALGIIAESL